MRTCKGCRFLRVLTDGQLECHELGKSVVKLSSYGEGCDSWEENNPRTIVQLIAPSENWMAVLCNDGTVWYRIRGSGWYSTPPIPQDEIK